MAGEKNPNWKGGRWTHSKGYVMVWVGREHPAACARDYAYEHTLNYFTFHGELPGDGWHLHHHDEDKRNNDPSNLEPKLGGEHSRHHLPKGSAKAREFGRKGGRAAARAKRKLLREAKPTGTRTRRR
jgi:hypothetical protein